MVLNSISNFGTTRYWNYNNHRSIHGVNDWVSGSLPIGKVFANNNRFVCKITLNYLIDTWFFGTSRCKGQVNLHTFSAFLPHRRLFKAEYFLVYLSEIKQEVLYDKRPLCVFLSQSVSIILLITYLLLLHSHHMTKHLWTR